MKIIYLIFLTLITTALFGQQNFSTKSKYSLVYQLTNEQALSFINDEFDEHTLTEPIDTLIDSYWAYKPKFTGHFLVITVDKMNVKYYYFARYNFAFILNKNDERMKFQLVDSTGHFLEADEVRIKGEKVKFDKNKREYSCNGFEEEKIIAIDYQGFTGYYNAKREKFDNWGKRQKSKYRSWKSRRYATYYEQNGYRTLPKRKKKAPFYIKSPAFGYVTTNKPMYFPNDTVKIKAYLVYANKKPYTKPLTVKIHRRGLGTSFLLEPTSDGNYIGAFILGDSLVLNMEYSVEFFDGDVPLLATYFQYSDYELDEISYTLRIDKREYQRHEPIIFYASGKNSNGQNVLDGEIEITAKIKMVTGFYEKNILIPDTLFHFKGNLDINGETRIIIPKEALPKADFIVFVDATFANSNGELSHKETYFNVVSDSIFVDFRLSNDTIKVDYLKHGKSIEATAKLTYEMNEFIVTKTIKLPYQEVVNPIFEEIEVWVGERNKVIFINGYDKKNQTHYPHFELTQVGDSIIAFAYNPNRLLVQYNIYRFDKKIDEILSNDAVIIWKKKTNKTASYRIDYQYITKGKVWKYSKGFDFAKNELDITIQQKTNIQPGETVDVTVQVKDTKNKAVQDVNLTALSVNNQFENQRTWRYYVPFQGKKNKKVKPSYYNYLHDYSIFVYEEISRNNKIKPKHQVDFGLDSLQLYRLLFPNNGLFKEGIRIEKDTFNTQAQFAIWIIRDGIFQPVHLVYANRKLVYFSETRSPYAFRGKGGINTITVRGKDFEVTLDSVELRYGYKTFISVDLDNLPKNAIIVSKPNYYTESEKDILRKSIFQYNFRSGMYNIYMQQNDVIYSDDKYYGKSNLGPFEANQNIRFIQYGSIDRELLFEPGFIYDISENRERLYQSTDFEKDKIIELPNISTRLDIEDELQLELPKYLFEEDKKTVIKKDSLQVIFDKNFIFTSREINYVIQADYIADSSYYGYIFQHLATQKRYAFHGKTAFFGDLPKGNYKLYGYTFYGNYFEHNLTIRKDTITYETIENITFQHDTNLVLLKSLLPINHAKVEPSKNGVKIFPPRIAAAEFQRQSSVEGFVFDENDESLMFSMVTLYQNGRLIKGTKTDFDGKYGFSNIEPGTYTIEVEYKGYQTKVLQNVKLFAQNVHEINFKFQAGDKRELIFYAVDLIKDAEEKAIPQIITPEYIAKLGSKNISEITAENAVPKSYVENNIIIKIPEYDAKRRLLQKPAPKSEMVEEFSGNFHQKNFSIDAAKLETNTIEQTSQIRSDFRDYAFWQPNLITDENGEAKFRVTYPDDVTSYQTYVLGMNNKYQFGMGTKTVQSQKVQLAQLAVPRFLIQGDKANVIGKSLNYSNDSLRIKSTFLFDENVLKTNDFWLNNLQVETAEIVANTDKDTLQLTYKMEHQKFFDGEKRPIPIYRKGVEETVGSFNILTGDTTVVLTFDKDKGNVKIYAQTDILEVLLKDVEYLVNYPYGCNEQTASRLLALLMDKQIKASLGQEKPKDEPIIAMVKRLEKAQNSDGSWGWWQGNSKNYWMTNYVLKALHAADTSGYKSASYETGLRFITNSLSQMEGQDLLNAIELLSDIQQNMDYEKHIAALDSQITKKDIYSQLIITKIKQQQGLQYDLTILDTLEKQTLFGNIFYEIDNSKTWNYGYRYWYRNDYNLTVLAYQILRSESESKSKSESKSESESKNKSESAVKLAAIRGYFLEKRTNYGWQNTFTTAQILSTILPDIANVSNQTKPQLIIKGNTTETVTTFPFETIFYANTDLEIQKTGTSTVYLTGYQQFWNEKPKPKNDIFELKTELKQDGKTVKKLEAKTPTKMVVTLDVKKEAEFVMVEVPIPAGCSYGEKSGNYGWYGNEAYREYFREKTCIFYQNLPVGTYTIEINLEPRFTGEYTVNPAKAEQMYFPVFYGRNGMKVVEIE